QSHFIDLRRRLDHADQHAHRQRGEQQRRGHQHRDVQRVLAELDHRLGRHEKKLPAKVPSNNDHPSTSTNSMILNGSEMIIGDTIIMPIDISTLATTRSMIRNGMNSRKPIWNAVFNSLVTKAGMATRNGTSSLLA